MYRHLPVRRRAICERFPKLVCKDVRGNLIPVTSKLDRSRDEGGLYDASFFARTGLQRLGFDDRISEVLDFPHAVAQGALRSLVGQMMSARSSVRDSTDSCTVLLRALKEIGRRL